MDNKLRNKTLLVCGVTCSVCGLIIFAISLFDKDSSYTRIALGILNIINGGLFLMLSKQK